MPTYNFTGKSVTFDDRSLLVSKTDVRGVISYANRAFYEVSKFPAKEIIGKPHAVIRHEFMPRTVFHLMWNTIQSNKEFFGFVVNRCFDEDYYWVFAHVTPDINPQTGEIIGYHSSRKTPNLSALPIIIDLYDQLRNIEMRFNSKIDAIKAGNEHLAKVLEEHNMTYEQFVFSIA